MFECHDAHAHVRDAYESWLLYTESNERDALVAKLNPPAFGECAAAQPEIFPGAV